MLLFSALAACKTVLTWPGMSFTPVRIRTGYTKSARPPAGLLFVCVSAPKRYKIEASTPKRYMLHSRKMGVDLWALTKTRNQNCPADKSGFLDDSCYMLRAQGLGLSSLLTFPLYTHIWSNDKKSFSCLMLQPKGQLCRKGFRQSQPFFH